MEHDERDELVTQMELLRCRGLSRRELLRLIGATGGAGASLGLAGNGVAQGTPTAGGASEITGGPIEVGVLWPEGSPHFEAVQRVIESVEEDIPGAEVTTTFANTAARPQIELRWQSGDPLDVDLIFNAADRRSHHWAEEGALLDLTETLKTTEWADGKTLEEAILPLFRPFLQLNDRYYAIPDQAVVMGVFYNQKIFDEAEVKPPTTWEELIEVGETIKAGGVAPIAVTGTFTPYMGLWWDHLLQRVVGSPAVMEAVYGDETLADNAAFLRAAEMLEDLVQRDFLLEGFEGIDFTAAQVEFFQGNAAMILVGSWLVAEMKESIPEGFELAVVPFPKVPEGEGDQNGLFGTVMAWSVASASENPALAVEYLRRTTSKEEQTKRALELGVISPMAGIPTPPDIPGLDVLLEQAAEAEFTFYYYGITFDQELSDAWYTPVAKLFFGEVTAEEMVKEIDENLARLRGR